MASESTEEPFPELDECLKLMTLLQSPDKDVRFQAIREFEHVQAGGLGRILTCEQLHDIFRACQLVLMNALRDDSEIIRERMIHFMRKYIMHILPVNDYYLSYLFPVIVERIGHLDVVEESEELRLLIVHFMHDIMEVYSEPYLTPFVGDYVQIMRQMLLDRFSAIKELSCKCVTRLAQVAPRSIGTFAINLVDSMLTVLTHQRFRVRTEGVRAMGEIIMNSESQALEDCLVPFAERLFDTIPCVRQAVVQVTARLLLEYRDRYSFFHKLLPLILTGLNDEVDVTRAEAQRHWMTIGMQYEHENEKELKDQLDFLIVPPKYYPHNLQRPNVGCRVIVQRYICRITAALVHELVSWQKDVRLRCSQLLCAVAHHAEEKIIQQLPGLLVAMYVASRDPDQRTVHNVVHSAEIMAHFVPPSIWTKLIIPAIETAPHCGQFRVLAAFIRCAPAEDMQVCVAEICASLGQRYIYYNRNAEYQRDLLSCVTALADIYSSNLPSDIIQYIFNIVVTLVAIAGPENEEIINDSLFIHLERALEMQDQFELWQDQCPALLNSIAVDPHSWCERSIERCIFETVLLKSGKVFGRCLDKIADILCANLDITAEAESRLATFIALSAAFEHKDIIFAMAHDVDGFLRRLIEKIFMPTLLWQAGRTAEAMRAVAAECLKSALTPSENQIQLFDPETYDFKMLCMDLMPLLLALCDDLLPKTRILAMQNVMLVKDHLELIKEWNTVDLVQVYPDIVKRMDDPVDEVRDYATKALKILLADTPEEFRKPTYHNHHEFLIDALVTHFDDEDPIYRALVFEAIKTIAVINPKLLNEKAKKYTPLVQNQTGLDEITKLLANLQVL